MLLSIILLIISQTLLWMSVGFYVNNFKFEGELRSFFFGLCVVGLILSVASIFSSVARINGKTKKKGIIELILSIIALITFIAYIVFRLTIRFNQSGLVIA